MWQPLSLVEARGHIRYRVMVTSTTASKRKRQTTPGVRICTLMSPCEVPANESSVLVGGLDPDTSYSVTVDAINSEDEAGPTSAPVIVTPASKMKQITKVVTSGVTLLNPCTSILLARTAFSKNFKRGNCLGCL